MIDLEVMPDAFWQKAAETMEDRQQDGSQQNPPSVKDKQLPGVKHRQETRNTQLPFKIRAENSRSTEPQTTELKS